MNWPPLKAWTSISPVEGQLHFVAINYGGELVNRWVILMSVLDSNVVVKVSWSQLVESSNWECGWVQNNSSNLSKLVQNQGDLKNTIDTKPSLDSGLTIPITTNKIRSWFRNVYISESI